MPPSVFLNSLVIEYCATESNNSRPLCLPLVGSLISGVCLLGGNSLSLNIHDCARAAGCRAPAALLLEEVLSCCSADPESGKSLFTMSTAGQKWEC